LGTIGFGGPIALVGYMQRDLVERRGWITPQEYAEGLAFCQLAPGPLAAQLAIYLGWIRGGVIGASLAGLAFIGPSFLMVLGLSALYVRFGGLSWMHGAFYGIGAAVIAIIARSAWKLARMTLGRDRLLWALCALNAVVTAWTSSEILWVLALSGVIALVAREHATLGARGTTNLEILWFFTKAGAVVFGSGLAIVPFLYGGVVKDLGWLTEREFLDAVAVSMITPGPVVITVAFIGYLTAGPLGAIAASIGVFLPVYVVVLVAAPTFRRWARNLRVGAFVDGVTAGATGAIAGAAVVLGRRAIIDWATLALAVGTLVLLMTVRKAPEPLVIVGAGVIGVLL
jgi:chromate transporter